MTTRNNIAVLVILYPTEECFIKDYTDSLRAQTYKDFDLIIINDNSKISGDSCLFDKLNIKEYKFSSTISKNREYGIKKVVELGYDYLIFSDIDDYYSPERIKETLLGFSEADIVVNDLDIVSNNKEVRLTNYFSKSISSETNLDLEFILSHNVFGFSNTGISTKIIDFDVFFPTDLRIVDWYFYTILLRKGVHAKYVDKALTNYRQHIDNLIGIGCYNVPYFKKMAKLKADHFEYLSELDGYFLPYKEKSQMTITMPYSKIEDILYDKRIKEKYPLWWEIVNI